MHTLVLDSMPSDNLALVIRDTTIKILAKLAVFKEIKVDSKVLAQIIVNTSKEWFPKIIEEARADAIQADILDGVKNERLDPLVKQAFSVGLSHACIKYAEFLLESL